MSRKCAFINFSHIVLRSCLSSYTAEPKESVAYWLCKQSHIILIYWKLTSKLLWMWAGVTLLGITETPLCIWKRIQTWAGDFPYSLAISSIFGSCSRLQSSCLACGWPGDPCGLYAVTVLTTKLLYKLIELNSNLQTESMSKEKLSIVVKWFISNNYTAYIASNTCSHWST